MPRFVLSMDQGTSSSRSILFNHQREIIAISQIETTQYFPQPGWVEQNAKEIWQTQHQTIMNVLQQAKADVTDIVAIGITNQRETIVVWDRATGEPITNAIVWQDRRTANQCKQMKDAGLESPVYSITGLKIDPYFSATKVQWILDNIPGARQRAEEGDLCMGTIDSWLIWNMTDGIHHITDATNASRTLLCNIHTGEWCDELLDEFMIPKAMLPRIVDSSGVVAEWQGVPISGIAGDQQAALFGQACYSPGSAKNTYGTGCFLLLNTGDRVVRSNNQLISTIALQIEGKREYALEGSAFVGGSLFQWLRDGLELFTEVSELDKLAASVKSSEGVVIIPAFTGLGAPHWEPSVKGLISGITRGINKAHICRAAVESICFQSLELIECMQRDASTQLTELKVDGGASKSDIMMQVQADLMGSEIVRPKITETTAFGAAALAGLAVGFWSSKQELASAWSEEKRFLPQLSDGERKKLRSNWDAAIRLVKNAPLV